MKVIGLRRSRKRADNGAREPKQQTDPARGANDRAGLVFGCREHGHTLDDIIGCLASWKVSASVWIGEQLTGSASNPVSEKPDPFARAVSTRPGPAPVRAVLTPEIAAQADKTTGLRTGKGRKWQAAAQAGHNQLASRSSSGRHAYRPGDCGRRTNQRRIRACPSAFPNRES